MSNSKTPTGVNGNKKEVSIKTDEKQFRKLLSEYDEKSILEGFYTENETGIINSLSFMTEKENDKEKIDKIAIINSLRTYFDLDLLINEGKKIGISSAEIQKIISAKKKGRKSFESTVSLFFEAKKHDRNVRYNDIKIKKLKEKAQKKKDDANRNDTRER